MSRDSRFNGSGCFDSTAYDAISKVDKEIRDLNKKAYDTIKIVKDLIDFCGFEVVERIVLQDKDTGREFR